MVLNEDSVIRVVYTKASGDDDIVINLIIDSWKSSSTKLAGLIDGNEDLVKQFMSLYPAYNLGGDLKTNVNSGICFGDDCTGGGCTFKVGI